MRNRQFLTFAVLILFSLSAAADTKIKTRNSMMGHSTESTVYIKGARERTEAASMGMGPGLVILTQCDQKRIITINPQANTCMVMPLGGESGAAGAAAPAAGGSSRKGGTITFNVNTVDTGERQKMLGLNARHIKSTMNAESSADACSKTSLHTESDGWYADIAPALSCSMGAMPPPSGAGGRSACQDTVRFKHTGGGFPGYPLKQTTTMQAEGRSFTTVSEVVELANGPLDASLFEMPAGCKVVSNYQELLNLGGMAAVLETRLRQAQAEAMAPIDLIACLVTDELTRRSERLLERRRKQAAFRDPNDAAGDDELRGDGAGAVKSAVFEPVSVQPAPARTAAVELLRAGAAPEPS